MPSRGLDRRVARLEETPGGTRGPCRVCRDAGGVALVDESRGETVEAAAGCPSCGVVSKVIVLERDGLG